jgi:hypothetical protein
MKLGGFDENMSGPEDFDFSQRIIATYGKLATARTKSFISHNEGHIQIMELWKRKFYYGRSLKHYFVKKENKQFNGKQGNIMYRYGIFFAHPLKLLTHPVLAVGMLVMKTGELMALYLGARL